MLDFSGSVSRTKDEHEHEPPPQKTEAVLQTGLIQENGAPVCNRLSANDARGVIQSRLQIGAPALRTALFVYS